MLYRVNKRSEYTGNVLYLQNIWLVIIWNTPKPEHYLYYQTEAHADLQVY